MQCNRQGCKNNFHVTCAQAHGLLCEEAGNYLDNVKYCGYCSYHYNKLVGTGRNRVSIQNSRLFLAFFSYFFSIIDYHTTTKKFKAGLVFEDSEKVEIYDS